MTLKIQNKDGKTVAVLKDDASEPTFVEKVEKEECVCSGDDCKCKKEECNDSNECCS